MKIQFKVQGEPTGKGRPRFTKTGRVYTPSKTLDYESLVTLNYRLVAPIYTFTSPVRVIIRAFHKPPKGKSKKVREDMLYWHILPTKKPDVDNIAKIVLDALNGVAWEDDTQVVDLVVVKRYDEESYVEVTIEEIDALRC